MTFRNRQIGPDLLSTTIRRTVKDVRIEYGHVRDSFIMLYGKKTKITGRGRAVLYVGYVQHVKETREVWVYDDPNLGWSMTPAPYEYFVKDRQ